MMTNVAREQAQLQKSSVKKLRVKYAELFGEETKSGNKVWLIKRILWRMQALQEGDLSERARQRAEAIANDADLRTIPPPTFSMGSPTAEQQTTTKTVSFTADERLPPPGTILTRRYKRQDVQVLVLESGFEWEGQIYRSLSAVAKAITGSHCNGYQFFRLTTGDDS